MFLTRLLAIDLFIIQMTVHDVFSTSNHVKSIPVTCYQVYTNKTELKQLSFKYVGFSTSTESNKGLLQKVFW